MIIPRQPDKTIIIDKTIIPARNDSSYRPCVRMRLQLDQRNSLTFVRTISPRSKAVAINESLVAGEMHVILYSTVPSK